MKRTGLSGKLLLGTTLLAALTSVPGSERDAEASSPRDTYQYQSYISQPRSFLDNVREDMEGVSSLVSGFSKGDPIILYGNWYGPGWWGGSTDAHSPGDLEPVDELDAAAQRHDFGYLVAERMGKIYGKAEEYRLKAIADAIAVEDARRLNPDPSKWNPPAADPVTASRYRNRIITGFRWETDIYLTGSTGIQLYNWAWNTAETAGLYNHPEKLDHIAFRKRVDMHVKRWGRKVKADGLIREAYEMKQQGDLAGAILKLEEAQELSPHEGTGTRILEFRELLKRQTLAAQNLLQKGYALEKEGDLEGAIAKYEAAQKLIPNDKVAARIQILRERIISPDTVGENKRPDAGEVTSESKKEPDATMAENPRPSERDMPGQWVSEGEDENRDYRTGDTVVDDAGTEFKKAPDGSWEETGERYEPLTREQKEQWNREIAGDKSPAGAARPSGPQGGTEDTPRSPGANPPTETDAASEKVEGREVVVGESIELDFSPPYRKRFPEAFEARTLKENLPGDSPNQGVAVSTGTFKTKGASFSFKIENAELGASTVNVGDGSYFDDSSKSYKGLVFPGTVKISGTVTFATVPEDKYPNITNGSAGVSLNGESLEVDGEGRFKLSTTLEPGRGCKFRIYAGYVYTYDTIPQPASEDYVWGHLEAAPIEAKQETLSSQIDFTYRSDDPVDFQPDSSADGRTRVTFAEPGTVRVWADVRITENGETRTEKTVVHVFEVKKGERKITLAGLKREGVFGQSQALSATITEKDKNSTTRVVWNASPTGNTFAQPFTEGFGNTLTFGRMGIVRVFADLQEQKEGAWVTVAESEVQEVEVVAPRFELVFTPGKDARIGETLRVKVQSHPKVPEELLDFRWTLPAKRQTLAPDASEISFVIGEGADNPAGPIPLRALVVAKGSGDRIAEIKDSYTPGTYELKVEEPQFRGPPPQVWDPERGGLVNAPRGSIVTHQQVSVGVSLIPVPKGQVRYAWSVSPDGGRTHGSTGRSQTFSAHAPGRYVISVVARTPGGLELARGQRSVSVMDSRTDSDTQDAENAKRAQALVKQGYELEKQDRLGDALRKYKEAQQLLPNEGVAKRIETVRKRIADRERAVQLVREAYALEQQDQPVQAIEKYEEAQALYPDEGVAGRIQTLRTKLANRERAVQLVREAYALEQQDQPAQAIEKYEEAQALYPDEGVAGRIQMLRGKLEEEEQQRREAEQQRRVEQERLAKQRRLAEQKRRAEQQKRDDARSASRSTVVNGVNLNGTYVGRDTGSYEGHRFDVRFELRLVQQGNQVTGNFWIWSWGFERGSPFPIHGTIQGNRLVVKGEVVPGEVIIHGNGESVSLKGAEDTITLQKE